MNARETRAARSPRACLNCLLTLGGGGGRSSLVVKQTLL